MPKKRLLAKPASSRPVRRSGKPKQQSKSPESRNRAMLVLRRMRKTGASLTAASREEHIDPRTVRKYLPDELKQTAPGRPYKPAKSDRLVRQMLSPTEFGMEPIKVRGSRQASRLGKYLSAVRMFLHTGATDQLSPFVGKSIGGHRLITDPKVLETLAQAGALQMEDIYATPGGAA